MERLAKAVIVQAIRDAKKKKSSECSFAKDKKEAISFLKGNGKLWNASLESWCFVAGISQNKIKKYANERWRD